MAVCNMKYFEQSQYLPGYCGSDGLLYLLIGPPVIGRIKVADWNTSVATSNCKLVSLRRPFHAGGCPGYAEHHQCRLPFSLGQGPNISISILFERNENLVICEAIRLTCCAPKSRNGSKNTILLDLKSFLVESRKYFDRYSQQHRWQFGCWMEPSQCLWLSEYGQTKFPWASIFHLRYCGSEPHCYSERWLPLTN